MSRKRRKYFDPRTLATEERRLRVIEMAAKGMRQLDIATQLGIDVRVVKDDLRIVVDRWKKEQSDVRDTMFLMDIERTNQLWADLEDVKARVKEPLLKLPVIDQQMKILAHRAKHYDKAVMGIDAPQINAGVNIVSVNNTNIDYRAISAGIAPRDEYGNIIDLSDDDATYIEAGFSEARSMEDNEASGEV